jgi:hypothetical protein
MKKALWLTAAFSLAFTTGVFADDGLKQVTAYLRPDFQLIVDGKPTALKDPPLIYENDSYLPVRELGTLLGAGIEWQEGTKSIVVTSKSNQASGSGGGASSPPEPVGTSGGSVVPSAPSTITIDKSKIPDTILLGTMVRYKVTYMGKTYPVLATQYRGSLFLLANDLQPMGMGLADVKLTQDKITKDMYISIDQMKLVWGSVQPKMELLDEPVVVGETNPDKLKYLKSLFSYNYVSGGKVATLTVQHIKALTKPDEYEFLCEYSNHQFIGYQIRLLRNSDGTWTYSTTGTLNLDNNAIDDNY